ncbi:MAG: galactose mutarotase [Bacteroidales bacterium]|nr:galactose mutarotase [Candidatus Sodaliphilus aphodohippi]
MKIEQKTVATRVGDITIYTITNAAGCTVTLSTMGAGIIGITVPDANGKIEDVVLGYADPADYYADAPCCGKVPGRFANRIARGKFSLDGKEYQLAINNGVNHLHGGPEGFNNKNWQSCIEGESVLFTLNSPDGDENYPGNLEVKVRYTWSEDNALSIDFTATTDAKTVVNFTNHAYFNLKGEGSGDMLDHELQIFGSRYLPTDDTLIPTGEYAPVAGTPMDFTTPKTIGRDIKQDFPALNYGKGYDNAWLIDGADGSMRLSAILTCKSTGRVLEVSTNQVAQHVYTGNWLDGSPVAKCGRSYKDYEGVALECEDLPDAPNHENFPSTVLAPGETFSRKIVFTFKTK